MTMLLATVLSVMASFFSAVPLDKTGTSGSEFRSTNAKDLENQAILEHRSNTAERKGFEPLVQFYPYAALAKPCFRPLSHLSDTENISAQTGTDNTRPSANRNGSCESENSGFDCRKRRDRIGLQHGYESPSRDPFFATRPRPGVLRSPRGITGRTRPRTCGPGTSVVRGFFRLCSH